MPRVSTLAFLVLIVPAAVVAAPPDPIHDRSLFSFPGSVSNPGSGASAGRALADRWLGDEPFDNPAGAPPREIHVSPVLLRMSRQDLRADNLQFDDQSFFVDVASVRVGLTMRSLGLSLYLSQPALRREDNAFERGERGGPIEPAVIQSRSTLRERRAGLALSHGIRKLRFGVGAEWTRRDDEYFHHETSGSPDAGDQTLSFAGDGIGVSVGARWELDGAGGASLAIGVGGRLIPSLDLAGAWHVASPLRQIDTVVTVQREAAWEAGVSVQAGAGAALRFFGGVGYRGAQEWRGFGVTAGRGVLWSLAADYHDPEEPWTARFGIGAEQQDAVPEPRAGLVSLGFGWNWGHSGLDLGILRRNIRRESGPSSFDDRVLATLRFAW